MKHGRHDTERQLIIVPVGSQVDRVGSIAQERAGGEQSKVRWAFKWSTKARQIRLSSDVDAAQKLCIRVEDMRVC